MPTEKEIIDKVNAKLSNQLSEPFLYQNNIIDILNYNGNTKDSRKSYIEVISETLLKNYEAFKNIGKDTKIRTKWCNNYDHKGELPANKSCLTERRLAIALFNSKKFCFGEIFDYEVPLKDKGTDKFGKIDLVSLHRESKSIKLIELKIKSSETLLRAVLEIYTYCKLIAQSKKKLFADYHERIAQIINNAPLPEVIQEDFCLQPVILSDTNSKSGEMMREIGKYPSLGKLIMEMNKEFKDNIKEFEFYDYNYNPESDPFIFKDNKPFLKKNSMRITKRDI